MDQGHVREALQWLLATILGGLRYALGLGYGVILSLIPLASAMVQRGGWGGVGGTGS